MAEYMDIRHNKLRINIHIAQFNKVRATRPTDILTAKTRAVTMYASIQVQLIFH
jgi:hypothetical protein